MQRRFILTAGAGLAMEAVTAARVSAQPRARPVVGFLSIRTPAQGDYLVAAVREGLKQNGFVDGENVVFEYRWAGGDIARLPALAAELVARKVDVIVAGGTPQPAKAATQTVPIVFTTGLDPVAYGMVASIGRPEGNVTGVTFYSGALLGKQLEFLREIVHRPGTVGLLVKPDSPSAAPQLADFREAAQTLGQKIETVNAATEDAFEPAIAAFARTAGAALIVAVDPYFDSHAEALCAAVARHRLPAIYNLREFVAAGGLMSYGASIADAYRQAGVYAGRILKGAKPSDLPVVLPTHFELVVNRRVAGALGLTVPPSLLARADEVID